VRQLVSVVCKEQVSEVCGHNVEELRAVVCSACTKISTQMPTGKFALPDVERNFVLARNKAHAHHEADNIYPDDFQVFSILSSAYKFLKV
jgi:hypothetical protein